MPRPPILKVIECIRLLESFGFVATRQKGSHCRFQHQDGRACTVLVHRGRDISSGVMRCILKDIEMTGDDFLAGPQEEVEIS